MIEYLSEEEFDDFSVIREPMASIIAEDIEWFCNSDKNLLGIIVRDKIDSDFRYLSLFQCNIPRYALNLNYSEYFLPKQPEF